MAMIKGGSKHNCPGYFTWELHNDWFTRRGDSMVNLSDRDIRWKEHSDGNFSGMAVYPDEKTAMNWTDRVYKVPDNLMARIEARDGNHLPGVFTWGDHCCWREVSGEMLKGMTNIRWKNGPEVDVTKDEYNAMKGSL